MTASQDKKILGSCKANIKKWIRDRSCGNTQGLWALFSSTRCHAETAFLASGILSLSRFYGTEHPIFPKVVSASPSLLMSSGWSYSGHAMSTSASHLSTVSIEANTTDLIKDGISPQLSPVPRRAHHSALNSPATMRSALPNSLSPGAAPVSTQSLDTSTCITPQRRASWSKETVSNCDQLVDNSGCHPLPQSPAGEPFQYSQTSPSPTVTSYDPHDFHSQSKPGFMDDTSVSQLWNAIVSDDPSQTLLPSTSGSASTTDMSQVAVLSSPALSDPSTYSSFGSYWDHASPIIQVPPLAYGTLASYVPHLTTSRDVIGAELNYSFSVPYSIRRFYP